MLKATREGEKHLSTFISNTINCYKIFYVDEKNLSMLGRKNCNVYSSLLIFKVIVMSKFMNTHIHLHILAF